MKVDQLITFAAVIFDFDGTLVDSMPLHYEGYRRVLADVGIELSHADFYENIGGNAKESIPKFLRGRPCPISVEEIHARKKALLSQLIDTEPVVLLPAARLLPELAGRVKLALASSGSRPGIEQLLARLDWRRHFNAVVTGEDAVNGKPAPDLFLLAAERLSAPPERCVVFEDTDAGVMAAHRAGMEVVDVRTHFPTGVTPV